MRTGGASRDRALDESSGSRRERRARLGLQWFEAERFTLENLQALSVDAEAQTGEAPRSEPDAPLPAEPAPRSELGLALGSPTWEVEVAPRTARGEALWNAIAAPPLRPGGRRERRRMWLAASLVWALALAGVVLAFVLADAAKAPAVYAPEQHQLPRPVAAASEAGPRHLFTPRSAPSGGEASVTLAASL